MSQSEKIRLLQELLDRIPNLKQLSYDNDEYRKWFVDANTILEHLFGRKSSEFRNFCNSICFHEFNSGVGDYKQQDYFFCLSAYEGSLKNILARLKAKQELRKVFRFQGLLRFIREQIILKI